MNVVRFLEDHAARIESEKLPFDRFEIVDFQADVVQAESIFISPSCGSSFEKSQIVKSVGDRRHRLRLIGPALRCRESDDKSRELFRLIGEISNVAKRGHEESS